MSTDKLKSKAIQGAGWSFIEAMALRGVQFAVGIVLARLLQPEQFGLIGMLTVFIAIAQTFLDSGFGAALIQKKEDTEKDTSSIFYFNILVGIIAAGCLCLVAPLVSDFYKQPILTDLLRAMSLILIINSFGLVQGTLLTRSINFKTQTKATLTASIGSGAIGIGMAWHGFGVWSLVVQQIASAVLRVLLLWVFSAWRPSWLFSLESLKEMFSFGSKLLASGLLNTIFENIYLVVIGKLFSPADLGYFTRANSLQQLPSRTLSSIVSRVAFPVFSSIQEDRERVKRGMKKALSTLALLNFPLMIGLAVVAHPLVLVLLTEKWLPCVPYLQLLSLVGLMFPLHLINLNVLQALGKSDLFLRLEIIKKMLVALNIAITWRWGIIAMVTGHLLISIVSYYLNAYYNRALINYSILEQIEDLYLYLFCALLMGGIVHSVAFLSFSQPIVLLACQIVAGGVVYLLLCRIFKLPAYMEMIEIARRRFLNKPILS